MDDSTQKGSGAKILIVAALALAVVGILVLKQQQRETADSSGTSAVAADVSAPGVSDADSASPAAAAEEPASPVATAASLPKLVDLGAGKCIPCKAMAPILEELKKDYAGRMEVVFIDVWEKPEAGDEYGIRMIPTQIFYAPDGKELFRHEGFFSREDILATWREHGYLTESADPVPPVPVAAD